MNQRPEGGLTFFTTRCAEWSGGGRSGALFGVCVATNRVSCSIRESRWASRAWDSRSDARRSAICCRSSCGEISTDAVSSAGVGMSPLALSTSSAAVASWSRALGLSLAMLRL